MRKLSVFNSVTLDGYFTGPDGDMSWAHEGADDPDFAAFTSGNAKSGAAGGGALVFGRATYDMMKAFWPTDAAKEMMPEAADGMNRMEKLVFSRTLAGADWENTHIINDDPVSTLRRLKKEPGSDMVILGSGSIVAPLAAAGLIDSYQVVVCPVAIGKGRTMFEGASARLKLVDSRVFKNGKTFLAYEPKA